MKTPSSAAAVACLGLILFVPLLASAPAAHAAAPATIEGRWRLATEARGAGDPTPIDPAGALTIEIRRVGPGLELRVWPSGLAANQEVWPPAGSRIDLWKPEAALGRLRVTWRTAASKPNGREVVFDEIYRLDAGGRALSAAITITDRVDGADGGSYTLTRAFERVP